MDNLEIKTLEFSGTIYLNPESVIKTENFEVTQVTAFNVEGVDKNGYVFYEVMDSYVTEIKFRGDVINSKAIDRMSDEGMVDLVKEYKSCNNDEVEEQIIIRSIKNMSRKIKLLAEIDDFKIPLEDKVQYAIDTISTSNTMSTYFANRMLRGIEGGLDFLETISTENVKCLMDKKESILEFLEGLKK